MSKIKKLKLQGFNNLTKTLSFNIYDICYAKSGLHKQEYIQYIDEVYNAKRLTEILKKVATIIGANVLNIAHQDYDPLGASVTMMICEKVDSEFDGESDSESDSEPDSEKDICAAPETILAHLDKSHLTVHTYPESHPDKGISTFRVDIDVSTCGTTSPLNALDYLIHIFDSDIITLDYRVRGFTRDINGEKHFIDHKIESIQNYLSADTIRKYQMVDVNIYQENIFHTKMILNEFELDNYLFGTGVDDLSVQEQSEIRAQLNTEMTEIYYGRNHSCDKKTDPRYIQ